MSNWKKRLPDLYEQGQQNALRRIQKDEEDKRKEEETFQQRKLREAKLFASQGAQNTRFLADQLTSGDLSSYETGDVKNLDRDILRQSAIDNAAYRQALSDMGLFDQKEYATNKQTIILPQTDYLKQLQEEFNLGRAASLVQDDFNKAATQRAMEEEAQQKARLPQLRSAYNDMAARGVFQNGNYTVEDLLYIDSVLNGTPRRSVDEFDALPDDEWAAEYERMEKAAASAQWDKLLNPEEIKAPEGYESQTPMYDEYLQSISDELTRRAEVERYERMADAMSEYAAQQGYSPMGTYESGYQEADINTAAGQIALGRRYANDQAYAINNPLSYDDAQKIIGEEMYGLEGAYNMTDEEKVRYNTLLKLNPQTANAYYQALLPELTARTAQAQDEYTRTRAEDPLLAALDTGAAILMGPVGTAWTTMGAMAGIDDPNNWVYSLQRSKDVTQETAAETYGKLWDTEFLGQPLGSTAYNAIVSLAEMIYAKNLSGGLTQAAGGGTTFAKAAMQTLMSSQSAAGTYMQDLERGFTPEQAAAHGLINGAIEAWSERGFMDKLFSDDGKFMYKVLTGGLAEGLEELESGGLQLVSDAMVSYLTDNVSEVEQVYNYYKQTMGTEAAKAQTMTYFAEQLALQGLTGWVTGAGTTGASEAGQYTYNRSLGKSIQKGGDPAAVLDVGLSMDPESASYKLATQIKARVDGGKGMSLADLGKLTGQLDEDLTSEQSRVVDGVLDQAIIGRLVELGATEQEARAKAQQVREVSRKGKPLTDAQKKRMGWDAAQQQVYQELTMPETAREANRRAESEAYERTPDQNQPMLAPELEQNEELLASELEEMSVEELIERGPVYPPDVNAAERRSERNAFARTMDQRQELAPETMQGTEAQEQPSASRKRSERALEVQTMDQNKQELAPDTMQGTEAQEQPSASRKRSERALEVQTMDQNRPEVAPETMQGEETLEQPRERRRRTETMERDQQELTPEAEPSRGRHEYIRSSIAWLDETDAKLREAQQKISDKRDKLYKAMTKTTAEDVSAAVENARGKTSRKNKKPENQRSKTMTYETADGSRTGEFDRFVQEGNMMRAVIKDGESETTVDLKQIMDEGGVGTATILEYTMEADHQMTAEEGNTMMQAYQETGGDAGSFIEDFEAVYAAGFAGIEAPTTKLPTNVQEKVYQEAVEAGIQAEEDRVNNAKRVRADTEGSVSWLGAVKDNNAIRGRGDQNALLEAMEGMTESQQTTVDVIQQMAKKLRVNVVLYESLESNIGSTANGMYNSDTNTLYVDINSGVSSAKGLRKGRSSNTIGYAMMLTMGHELTHHLEATSPEGYTRYRDAVKKQLAANGENWVELVRGKILTAAAQGRKLTRKGAEAEVIADASEYMLQNSRFVTGLEGGLRSRVRTFVQGFVEKVRSIFNNLVSGHRESTALRRVIDGANQYTGDLQKLWDAALGETITKPEAKHAGAETEEESPRGRRAIAEARHAGAETEEDYTALLADEGVSSMEEFQEKIRRESMELNADRLKPVVQFSMDRNVEVRTNGLMAVHNIKEPELESTLKLGGFPMPSIAIIKAKEGHTMYGEYSVVFGKETIDPKASAKNRVYGADAWTPVFPRTETEVLEDAMYDRETEIGDLAAKVDEEYSKKARAWFSRFSGSDTTSETMDVLQDSAWNNDGMLAAYMADHGENVQILEKDVEVSRGYNPARADMYNQLLDIVDLADLVDMKGRELIDKYSDQLAAEIPRPFARLNANWKQGDRQAGVRMLEIFKQATAYEGSGRDTSVKTEKVKDYYATGDTMRSSINRDDFREWVKEKLQDAFGMQGIYNGKVRFTPSGNRRSFKQLHDPVTAENVVKAMAAQEESNIPATDASGLMAAASSMYKSIAEIKADANRLGKISDEEYNARIAKANNTHHDLLNAIEAWDYDQVKEVGELLVQAAKKRMDASAITVLLKRNGYKATQKAGEMAADLIHQVQTIPSGYFEAKPARVVGFDEIKMIVAPESMPKSLATQLDKSGIPYTTYDGTDADRLKKLNAVKNVQFSQRDNHLLNSSEYARFMRNWESRKRNHFTKRQNGGILIDVGNLLVYTDKKGRPQHVLEVLTDDLWTENAIIQAAMTMEKGGIDFGTEQKTLERIFAEGSFRFRNPGDGQRVQGENGRRATRYRGTVRGEVGENLSETGASSDDEVMKLSTRDLPDGVSVREYLGAMKPTSRMTDTERELLKRYQDKLKTLQETEDLAAKENEILKQAHGDDLLKAKSRYMTYRNKANRISRELARIERAEGFAGLMASSRMLLDEYLLGTAGSMADAQDKLDEEVQNLTNRLQVIGNTLEGAAQGQRNAFARGLFDQKQLDEAARQLKDSYNSRMSVKNIANRLALAYGELYANEGAEGAKKFTEAAKELAQDILNSSKYRYRSEVLTTIAEELPTISLTETDKQEIRNAGLTLTEYKRGLSPYVRVVEGASDLSSYVSNAEAYGGQIARILGDDTEGNLAMALYNAIQAEKTGEAAATFEGMNESQSLSVVMADVVSLNLPKTTNSDTLEYLRKELQKYAGENEEASRSVDAAIKAARSTTARASDVWREAVKAKDVANKVVEYYRALEEQRRLMELQEQKKELTEQLKSDAAKKLHDKIQEQRQEYREREQKAREYRRTRADVEKLRKSIGRKVKRLNALRMRETDQKHVPQEMQHVADVIMQTFTESALSKLAFAPQQTASLARRYRLLQELEHDMAYYWDDEIDEDIYNLQALSEAYSALTTKADGSPSRVYSLEGVALETEILQGVDAIVSNVMRMIDSVNDSFLTQRTETFDAFATKTGEDLLKHDDAKVRKGKLGNTQLALDEWFRTGNMTPIYFFESLKNKRFTDVFNEIRRGQTEAARIIRESQEFVQAAKEKHHYGRWVGDAKLTIKTGQGHNITLSREQAMWAYATAKRERSNPLYKTEHLISGGFQYKDTSNTGEGKYRATDTPHQLDTADIAKIEQWLTDEQKAYADEIVGYLSTVMAEYGNEASMRMYGYKKFLENYYFPFQTSAEQRVQKGDEGAGGESAGTGRLRNSGFTKKLQHKANATLMMDDFTTVAVEHMQKMANYSAMVEPIEDLKRLLNHKVLAADGTIQTIRALIGQKYGKPAQNYLQNLLKDLNGATQGDKRAMKGVDYMVNAFKRGAVMGSLSVVLQQPTALARAMSMVNPKYFTANPFYRPSKGVWEKMLKHSGTAIIKDMGRYDVGMGKSASEYIMDEHLTPRQAYDRLKNESKAKGFAAGFNSFMNWLTSAPGKADQWTWGLLWQACERETADKHPGMNRNSEEFLDLVGERFDEVVDHTQVYDSVLTRSELMRSTNAFHKMATSFMAEPTLAINMLYNAFTGGHSKAKAGVIIGSVMASQIMAGLMAALVQAWNDDKDKRNWAEKYADKASSNILDNINPLGMVPYISDFISLAQGYEVERADMTVASTLIKYTGQFWDKLSKGEALTMKDWENFAGNWANLTGIPAKNILREIRRTKNAILNTDWGAPNMSNLGYVMMENTPFYDSSTSVYYERLAAALLKGDEEEAENLRGYMLTSKMVTEEKLTKGLRNVAKEMLQDGELTEAETKEFLLDNKLVDSNKDAFTYVDKWKEEPEGEDDEDYSHSVYNSVKKAIDSGNAAEIKASIKELTDNGWKADDVTSKVREYVRESYIAGKMTQDKVKSLYKSYCLPSGFDANDKNDWYWLFKELDYYKKNGEDAARWEKYGNFYAAIEGGRNLKAVIKEYMDHGVEKQTLSSSITSRYKKRMLELKKSGKKSEMGNLQAWILTAYQALGYDRDKKLKDIQKWLEEP